MADKAQERHEAGIPARPIPAAEWAALEAGLVQRIEALNLFLRELDTLHQTVSSSLRSANMPNVNSGAKI